MVKRNIGNLCPGADNTCAIITLYYPEFNILEHINRIESQVSHIIIICNACDEAILSSIKNNLSGLSLHKIISNPYNFGLGYALNQGIGAAQYAHMKWVLLLDQDTLVDADIIGELANIVSSMPKAPAILGSNYRDIHSGRVLLRCADGSRHYQRRATAITSGTLLNMECAQVIGEFKTEYFIDSIDHEYCLRAGSLGFGVYISCKPLMSHSIGMQVNTFTNQVRCLFSQPHSPERKYYIARNSIATARTYIYSNPYWSVRQLIKIFVELVAVVVFEDYKMRRIKYMLAGVANGLKHNFKAGPLEMRDA